MTQINLKQGDATTLTETITGLSSLTGYSAKLYIYTKAGVAVGTLTGTISTLTITYEVVNDNSKSYPIGAHNFETKIWDAFDHVYTPTSGTFNVEAVLNNDPS